MEIHILDWVMWLVIMLISGWLIDVLSSGDLTQELGGLVGCSILLVITIIHIILFWFCGWNWIDIFQGANPQDWFNIGL